MITDVEGRSSIAGIDFKAGELFVFDAVATRIGSIVKIVSGILLPASTIAISSYDIQEMVKKVKKPSQMTSQEQSTTE